MIHSSEKWDSAVGHTSKGEPSSHPHHSTIRLFDAANQEFCMLHVPPKLGDVAGLLYGINGRWNGQHIAKKRVGFEVCVPW